MAEPSTEAQTVAATGQASPSTSNSRAKLALHRKLVFSYALIGLVVGAISFLINVPLAALALMIIVGVIATFTLKRWLKPVAIGGKRWWSSGAAVYVFMWLVVWTILFNMYIVKP